MSLFVFNNSQKLIEVIPDNKLIHMEQEEELNKLDAFFAEIPLNVWSKLKEKAFYLAFQDAYDRFSYHMYRISKEDTEGNEVQLTGIQIGHDELKAKGYIKDRRFIDSTVTEAMNAIVLDTDWVLGYVDPELSKVNTNFYYISRLEAL